MSEYGLNGFMGATIARGIPSQDVAISVATDMERYDLDDDDNDDHVMVRRDVFIVDVDEGFGTTPYIHVFGQRSRGVAVVAIHRCPTCHREGTTRTER
jgi:hypothetical protein